MVPRLVRRERRYCLAMCAVVLVLFTVAHWRSYTILTKESNRNTLVRSKLLVKDLKNRKNTSRGLRPGYVAHSVITDAICSVKGVSFSASCHEGINRFNQNSCLTRGVSRRPCWRAETMNQFCMRKCIVFALQYSGNDVTFLLPSSSFLCVLKQYLYARINLKFFCIDKTCPPNMP